MADRQFVIGGVVTAPADWDPPAALTLIPKTAFATFDGTGAAGPFVPVLEIISNSGHVAAIGRVEGSVAAGGTAIVSWFPGGDLDSQTVTPDLDSGITTLTSTAGSIGVTNPTGPTTNVDLPASGVTAGTYGDATHTSQVTVGADGIISAAHQVAISGIAGSGLVKLFDTTLGVAAASIDTGANAIPTGHGCLFVVVMAQTSQAVANSTLIMRLNGDSAAHYDMGDITAVNTNTPTAGRSSAITDWIWNWGGTVAGEYPSTMFGIIPAYDQTVLQKVSVWMSGMMDQSGQAWGVEIRSGGWRSTAAINQIAITAGSGNLVAGSELAIYGTQ